MAREFTLLRLGRLVRWLSHKLFKFTPDAFCDGVRIYYWIEPTTQLRIHEHQHIRQAEMLGVWRWRWRYLMELRRHGYDRNVFEVDARRAAGQDL